MIIGASSPRVSLARTSSRTRYCCPRLLGSTWSRMSPSRRPPTLVSGDQSVRRYYGALMSVPWNGSGTTEARPPASSVPPVPHGGSGGLLRHPANSGPDFRSSSSFLSEKMN